MSHNNHSVSRLYRHGLSIDVEDYYDVSAFENILSSEDKNQLPIRVHHSTHKLMDILGDKNIKATFFTLGKVAKAHPAMIKRMTEEGHEVASHGMNHIRVRNQSAEEFFDDILETKKRLEDISGTEVIGYRAASFSMGKDTPFAYDKLIEAGYTYSSSINPIAHDHYGDATALRQAHFVREGSDFIEIPVSVAHIMHRRIPAGGGGWFRLMPYFIYKRLLNNIIKDNIPLIFYTHPWEFDPEQPRIPNLPFKTRFRHYVNLGRTISKLNALCDDYRWGKICDIARREIQYLKR